MTSPSDPGQKGSKGVYQDGMSEEGHKEQYDHACEGMKEESGETKKESDEE